MVLQVFEHFIAENRDKNTSQKENANFFLEKTKKRCRGKLKEAE